MATSLDDYGLLTGEEVRFRWKRRGAWREGRVLGVHDDGSLRVHDVDRGYSRALTGLIAEIEHMTKGPRGGTRWVPVKETK